MDEKTQERTRIEIDKMLNKLRMELDELIMRGQALPTMPGDHNEQLVREWQRQSATVQKLMIQIREVASPQSRIEEAINNTAMRTILLGSAANSCE